MPESIHLKTMRNDLTRLQLELLAARDVADRANLMERIEILQGDIRAAENWERLQDSRRAQELAFSSNPSGGA